MSQLKIDIDEKLHHNFKIACVKRRRPMREMLINFIENFLADEAVYNAYGEKERPKIMRKPES